MTTIYVVLVCGPILWGVLAFVRRRWAAKTASLAIITMTAHLCLCASILALVGLVTLTNLGTVEAATAVKLLALGIASERFLLSCLLICGVIATSWLYIRLTRRAAVPSPRASSPSDEMRQVAANIHDLGQQLLTVGKLQEGLRRQWIVIKLRRRRASLKGRLNRMEVDRNAEKNGLPPLAGRRRALGISASFLLATTAFALPASSPNVLALAIAKERDLFRGDLLAFEKTPLDGARYDEIFGGACVADYDDPCPSFSLVQPQTPNYTIPNYEQYHESYKSRKPGEGGNRGFSSDGPHPTGPTGPGPHGSAYARLDGYYLLGGVLIGRWPEDATKVSVVDLEWRHRPSHIELLLQLANGSYLELGAVHTNVVSQALRFAADGRPAAVTIIPKPPPTPPIRVTCSKIFPEPTLLQLCERLLRDTFKDSYIYLHPVLDNTLLGCGFILLDQLSSNTPSWKNLRKATSSTDVSLVVPQVRERLYRLADVADIGRWQSVEWPLYFTAYEMGESKWLGRTDDAFVRESIFGYGSEHSREFVSLRDQLTQESLADMRSNGITQDTETELAQFVYLQRVFRLALLGYFDDRFPLDQLKRLLHELDPVGHVGTPVRIGHMERRIREAKTGDISTLSRRLAKASADYSDSELKARFQNAVDLHNKHHAFGTPQSESDCDQP